MRVIKSHCIPACAIKKKILFLKLKAAEKNLACMLIHNYIMKPVPNFKIPAKAVTEIFMMSVVVAQ